MSFLELYKSGDRSSYEQQAFHVLVTNLLSRKMFGVNKATEITAHNMEQSLQGDFIPTMFYTFMYAKPEPEQIGRTEFYDVCPMILCTHVDYKYVTGINFNMIPNNVRASILDVIYNSFDGFYQDVNTKSGDNLPINNKFGVLLSSESGLKSFLEYVKMVTSIDISAAVRKYSRDYIKFARMIEYDQWVYIPFLTFDDSVRGVNLAKLQGELIYDNVETENK